MVHNSAAVPVQGYESPTTNFRVVGQPRAELHILKFDKLDMSIIMYIHVTPYHKCGHIFVAT